MNRYHDLSREELANLNEEQINHYIEVEIAHKGVEPAIEPEVPTIEDIGITKEVSAYRVGGSYSSLLFLNQEDAKAVALLPQMEEKYTYSIGSDYKWLEPKEDVELSEQQYYLQADIVRLSKAIQDNNAKQKLYREAKEKWDGYLKETSESRELVWEAVTEAKEFFADVKLGVQSYQKFLTLSEGNMSIADKFFRDAYANRDELFIDTVLGHPDLNKQQEEEG